MAAAAECCASCRLSNRRKKGRTCSSCQDYFHLSCVNLTNRSSQKITTWNCKNCMMNYDTQPETNSLDETNTPNDNITVNTNFLKDFVKFKKNQRVLLRISKAARTSAADALAVAINAALKNGTQSAWEKLFGFANFALALPYRSTHNSVNSRVSLATTIKNNIELFLHSSSTSFLSNPVYQPSKPVQFSRIETDSSVNSKLAKRVMAKLMEGDVTAAVRVVASDDRVVPLTDDVLRVLQLKHPSSPQHLRPTPVPSRDTPSPAHAIEKEIMLALRSFPASSSGGIDGLRPGHLKDLTSPATVEAGRHLRSAITDLINRFLLGDIPPFAREMFFSASLTALKKKDGGVRPIAVGNVFRRLAAKIACRREMQLLGNELRPVQLGVGVSGGCEAAVHAVRCFSSNTNSKNIIVKLDIKNAFNSIRRDHLLETCLKRTPCRPFLFFFY